MFSAVHQDLVKISNHISTNNCELYKMVKYGDICMLSGKKTEAVLKDTQMSCKKRNPDDSCKD